MTEQLEKKPEATPAEERGDRPMLAEGPTFELAGHRYTMRRLNYADHSRFAGILDGALRRGKIDLVGVATRGKAEEQIETVISLLLGAFTHAPTEVLGFLASVLEVDRPTLLDPERFPFASLPMVLRKLTEHPDLTDFFVEIGVAVEGRPIPTPASNGPSISSPGDTVTPTDES